MKRMPIVLLATAIALESTPVRAQDQVQTAPGSPVVQDAQQSPWLWTTDVNVFFGFNHQQRKFRDFSTWESQNWISGVGQRAVSGGTLTVSSMLSLEALTLRDIGSPQVFQTGETFLTAPLIDYQHPHDLVMGLGVLYRRPLGRIALLAAADVVGPSSLGPPAFMHRPSARDNPQTPLSHHYLDSSHITPGVLRGGVEAGAWRVDASWFRGREPDEERLDLDLGELDSGALRIGWTRGVWSAQVSGAYVTKPQIMMPLDEKKLTASLAYSGGNDTRGIDWLLAFGQDRDTHGNLEAYLFEATFRPDQRNSVYTRLEVVAKDILDAGFHRPGFRDIHRQSQIGAVTIGYVRNLFQSRAGSIGVGGDITGYAVPLNLQESYGDPLSLHVFLRYHTPRRPSAHVH